MPRRPGNNNSRIAGLCVLCALGASAVSGGCASTGPAERSQQGFVNVDRIVPKLAGILREQQVTDERIQTAMAAVVDQRTQNVWNDVQPWITGAVVTVGIIATGVVVVLVFWIRWNSYLRQKPVYERHRGPGAGQTRAAGQSVTGQV